jgi:hypothetical protein
MDKESAKSKGEGPAMNGSRMRVTLGLVTVMILVGLGQAALVHPAAAQQAGASVELKRVVGRVEILRTGQHQWLPAVVGARLLEGDDIRAFSGASADLKFPDTSMVELTENSRLLVSKLAFDPQQQSRLVLLHLTVGKVRASVAQTAITLARPSQSHFAISTPTAVASAKGTIVWVFTDGQKSLMAVEPESGKNQPKIECITLDQLDRKRQLVLAGTWTTDCAPPVLTPSQFLTLVNSATAGANLGAIVAVPSSVNILALLSGPDLGDDSGVSFSVVNAPATGLPGPTSFGRNEIIFAPPPACATDPCN